ncbi:LPS export ABC transporter periplasmic protein LptC [Parabacteroides sp. Marseille-P3160]|uniref:LPS export ABC transporter periplasmic protein LptC n=1 Tax=Parabacteroides sp. Marseille-P3160 TaxID=1917887 RepID=UPI0009B9C414|nr:LPS export ABC transporter periplasmic protein LptC [Parabacteroides sp. Marseille-P3160]
MSRRLPGNTGHPGMTAFVLLLVVPLFFHVSCRKEPKEIVEVRFNPDSTYTMKTLNMTTFISDSGITKYKMVTPECLMFEEAREPYWFFPKGVYAEQFDTLLQVEASVKADTAFYYVKKDMITLIGNVHIVNREGQRFETSLLHIDRKSDRVYSDKFIRIEQADRIITGIGFESTMSMSKYRIFSMQGTFPIEEKPDTVPPGANVPIAAADSI